MSESDTQVHYTRDHEWLQADPQHPQRFRVGITTYASEQLGEVVFVELPEVGREVKVGDGVAVLESVKAASDAYAPLQGTIVAVNDAVRDDTSLLTSDPQGAGWLFVVETTAPLPSDTLLSAADYQALTQEGSS